MNLWRRGDGTQWDLEAVTDTCAPQPHHHKISPPEWAWEGVHAYLSLKAWEAKEVGTLYTHPKCWASTLHRDHAVAGDRTEEAFTWYHRKYPCSVLYRGVSNQSPACNPHHEKWTEESEQRIKQELTHVWHFKTHLTFFSWFAFAIFINNVLLV